MAPVSAARLIVVGGGAAGTAAAWFAARAGVNVLMVRHLPGATELYSGALNLEAWEEPQPMELDDDTRAFARALGIWAVERGRSCVSTGAGLPRTTQGFDQALLDLEPLAGHHVAVADTDREHYDGVLLARALAASEWAQSTGTRFEPVRVNLLRREQERRYPEHDFAELHDAPERIEWMAEQLNRASPNHDAWLLGPWLGLEPDTVAHLRLALLRPVGETTSLPGGAAGERFRRARDRLLEAVGVGVTVGRVRALSLQDGTWLAELEDSRGLEDASATYIIQGQAVVLAVGGLVSGAIEFAEFGADAPVFRLSLQVPVTLGLEGTKLTPASSLHGPVFTHDTGPSALEGIGILTRGCAIQGRSDLFAAGACMAGRPRTVLDAVRTGITAARIALGRSVRPPPMRR
jgi:glycine/D-amino acid oxidase-like deaminating enzyme